MWIGDGDSDDEISTKLRRHGMRIGRGMIAPRVFWPALVIILAVVAFAVIAPDATDSVFKGMNGWIVTNLGWYYMLVVGIFVAVAIGLGVSRFGRIRLGKDDEKPEFGLLSWFAMLFAAGMGIGLVFYSVGEPLTYATTDPKPGWDGSGADLAGPAMAQTFLHWGLHPWAIYAVVGLALAYAIHRRGRPVSIRWALEPILGRWVRSWVGDLVDVLAIVGTLFGIATSLGLGVKQISVGLASMGIVETGDNLLLIVLIIVITFLATLSVVSGVGAGIKWLSNINLSLAGLLLIAVLLLGPTVFLFQNLVEALGIYLGDLFQMTFDVGAYQRGEGAADWFSNWTVFYWGWWISWSPFVGVFIARISRGRTIRQFVAGVLLVPTIVGFLWFSVLGGTGLFEELFGGADIVANNLSEDGSLIVESAIFDALGRLPLGSAFSFLAILLVAIFFITSSDSGSLVVDMLASGGHPNPPIWSRVLWATLEGLVAAALLLAGGLGALQAAALATALPFSIVLLAMCWANVKALRLDSQVIERDRLEERLNRVTDHIADVVTEDFSKYPQLESYVDDRIDYRLSRTRTAFGSRPTPPAKD
ncbi:BCCT family transporter [Pseudactinotalea sp. HY160]|uniref:BCCT family transporter n=1 Tax=Pseudactinotalea sp. HY160 TaxID=2654490 RepID=UPI00128DAC1E|nr:BCCT family transporter [Pseudactinotalea sp. HY160]MPV50493.1 BCCT family transporter [Pseudactinotalea sp. HY160]